MQPKIPAQPSTNHTKLLLAFNPWLSGYYLHKYLRVSCADHLHTYGGGPTISFQCDIRHQAKGNLSRFPFNPMRLTTGRKDFPI